MHLKTAFPFFTLALLTGCFFDMSDIDFFNAYTNEVNGHPVEITPYEGSASTRYSGGSVSNTRVTVGDTVLELEDSKLTVNGAFYGALTPGASIRVDHGTVWVDGMELKPKQAGEENAVAW